MPTVGGSSGTRSPDARPSAAPPATSVAVSRNTRRSIARSFLSSPDRLTSREVEQRDAPQAVVRLPIAAQPLHEVGERLVLFGLCDVQIVHRDAADHVAVVGHLE